MSSQPVTVKGAVALVTGANRGIGKAIVDSLIAAGASKVYAAVRKHASADALVSEHGDTVVPLEFDLTREDTIQAAAKTASDAQIVVNNGGILFNNTLFASDAIEKYEKEFDTNVLGLLRTARAFAPVLKRNGGGALVQVNSVASMKSFSDFATYCASKAAAYSITQALRSDLAEQGTLVVSVHPGPIATDMGSEAGLDEIAEPPSLVADSIIDALQKGEFHAFPDSIAKQVGEAYRSFAESVIEAEMAVG